MTIGPATQTVVEITEPVEASVEGHTRLAVGEIVDRAAGPFVVAVAGRLKAGKSTLVNALLGRAAAATAVGECTTLVTRFVDASSEYVTIHRHDGTSHDVPLRDGAVPDIIAAGVDHLEVKLVSSRLEQTVIVDTPGLASLVSTNSDRTENFLDLASQRACTGADAIVYLLNGIARGDDVDVLRRFLTSAGDRSGTSAIGVLNKADQVTGGFEAARAQAVSLRSRLADLTHAVVPVVALAAQASRCGTLTGVDLTVVAELAALDADLRQVVTSDRELLLAQDLDASAATRMRLVDQVGLVGVGVMAQHLANQPGDRAGALQALDRSSGFDQLDQVFERLVRRSDAIKAQQSIAALERLAWSTSTAHADAAALHRCVSALRDSPALVVIDQLRALDLAATVSVLDDVERAELERLFTSGDPADRLDVAPGGTIAEVAWDAATRWHAVSASPASPARREVARVARHTYLSLWNTEHSPSQ